VGGCKRVATRFIPVILSLKTFLQQLPPEQTGVNAVGGDEVLVWPSLHEPSIVQHQDLVGFHHRGHPVADDEGRPLP
jgi:hypothetical protein